MFNNRVLNQLPRHLFDLVIQQPYNSYTMQDHAVWRYVMLQNLHYLKDKAHTSYLEGLKKTGISIDHIPDMVSMNQSLEKMGWAAVTVDGFIPPAAFMEFQAYNVLVIAADIRPINQIEYTPAPDIIHEAAGHAPIIADDDYAAYLKYFGEIGSKAFSSSADYELYEAIRYLSILKADPNSTTKDIEAAEALLAQKESLLGIPSEMALIRNLHWWTVEYGLIGSIDHPKIYGAGLLSSIGESKTAMSESVKKLPYDIDAVYYNFDITKPQPQLFVTPDFEHLTKVLDEFASRMALRKGGVEGILKAIESQSTATCVYSSGLQVSGTFTEYLLHQNQLVYMKTKGPTLLSYMNKQLEGHGKKNHPDGFGSPIGRIKNTYKPPRFLEDQDLKDVGIEVGKQAFIEFESGIEVKGRVNGFTRKEGKLLLIHFSNCHVQYGDTTLFQPDWGTYDMAVGESIVSAYTGPADPNAFGLEYQAPKEKTHKIQYTGQQQQLHKLYQVVRNVREHKIDITAIYDVWDSLEKYFPHDWLLRVEIAEIIAQSAVGADFKLKVHEGILGCAERFPETAHLINKAMILIK